MIFQSAIEEISESARVRLPSQLTGAVYVGGLVAALLGVLPVWWWLEHIKFERAYGKATYRPKFNPLTALGIVFEDGLSFTWKQRFTLYKTSKKELIILEPTIWGKPILYSSSAEVLRQVGGGGTVSAWYKPEWISVASNYWGNHLLGVNDLEWRKHRRIVQPAFNPKTYEMVWNETKRLYGEMLSSDQWPLTPGGAKAFEHAGSMTKRLTLCIILSCGFGFPLGWKEEADAGNGTINLDNSIKFQSENLLLVCFAPDWVLNLPFKKMRFVSRSRDALRAWFNYAISKKKSQIDEVLEGTNQDMEAEALKRDVFTRINLASRMDARYHLEDSEIIGNTWLMFFAGHETTASVLSATLCFLAMHKGEQNAILEEIQQVSNETADGDLGLDQYEALIKTKSAFVEALRLLPPGFILLRESREDTTLLVPAGTDTNGDVIEEAVPVPKGTVIAMDVIGIQLNPRVFPNPEVYRPSRWYNNTSDEAITAFSIGPRACVGRRFALTEAVCFLAHLLRDYEVRPLLEKDESVEAWKERVLGQTKMTLTLTIAQAPIVFIRR